METTAGILSLLFFLSLLTFGIGFFMLLSKRRRRRGLKLLIGSVAIIVVSLLSFGFLTDRIEQDRNQAAIALGFKDASEREEADIYGYETADEWKLNKERVYAEERAELRRLREERLKKEEAARTAKLAAQAEAAARQQAIRDKEQAEKDAHQARLAAKTIGMTGKVVEKMSNYYDTTPEGLFGGTNYCREDGYCGLRREPFGISIYGAGLVTLTTSTQVSFSDYIELCAVTFSAISGSSMQFSMEAIGGAFGKASQVGSFKYDLSGIQIKAFRF